MDLHGTTVLVTGASGFIGGALARRLRAEGAVVRGLVRRPVTAAEPAFAAVRGDLRDASSLRAAVEGAAVVFHCAAYMGTRSLERGRDVTVEGTRRLVDAMAGAGVRRLIHLSTMAVYAATPPPLTEDARLRPPRGVYGLTKLEAEHVIRERERAGTLAATVFRPPIVYGPGSPVWTRDFARQVRQGRRPLLGDGRGRWHYVYVDDLIDALVLAARTDASAGRTYNLEDGWTTWADWVERFRRIAGGPAPRRIPLALVRAAAAVAGGRFGLPRAEDLGFLTRTEDEGFHAGRARAELGWTPRTSLDEGIARAAAWLREEGLIEDRPG